MRCLARRIRADSLSYCFCSLHIHKGHKGRFCFCFDLSVLFHIQVGASVGGVFLYRMWSFVFHSCDVVLSNEYGAGESLWAKPVFFFLTCYNYTMIPSNNASESS